MIHLYEPSEQALVEGTLDPTYRSIVKSTRLLVFFATPHLGGNYSGIGDFAAKIVRTGLRTPSNDLLEGLKSGSRDVIRRFEQARHLPDNCLVISFYETENYGRLGLVSYIHITGMPASYLVTNSAPYFLIFFPRLSKKNPQL
jgi:hypothetical protein